MSKKIAPTQARQPKTELLAPAGGLTAFFAAMEAGADAIYCGSENFSARAKAKNFSMTDLTAMTNYAHRHNKKIYVALNTLIKEAEIPLLIETLEHLEYCAIDGIIIQDLAIRRLVKYHFPSLALHASTQMTVHNAAGVNTLASMGFKRVVLARELSLAEIGAISRKTEIELEHFIHGALCFSMSGQCLFSSFISGKSGNRGRCIQPCRRRFNYQKKSGYYFSTSDLCAIEQIPQLIAAGITSFKIEGRMKSPEYVGRVVAAYRMVLDAPIGERSQAQALARQQLELSFGRRTTTGFLCDEVPTTLTAPSQQGTIGHYLGMVISVRDKTIFVKLEGRLHIGDRLKAMPKNDQTGVGLTVINLQINQKKVKVARQGATVNITTRVADKIHPGDAIYRVAAEQAFSANEDVCRQKLTAGGQPQFPLVLELQITPEQLTVQATVNAIEFAKVYELQSYPAQTRPLDEAVLVRAFMKTGKHPFVLEKLVAEKLPAIVIPPSLLNEIRRNLFETLAKKLTATMDRNMLQKQQEVLATLQSEKTWHHTDANRHLTLTVSDIPDIEALNNPLVDRIAIPLTPDHVRRIAQLTGQSAGRRQDIIWDIPVITFPADWPQLKTAVQKLLRQGFTTFRLNNIGHLSLFDDIAATELIAGSQLYTMNSETIRSWQELGFKEITLAIENDRQNIAAIMARKSAPKICLPIYAPITLMTSRIPVPEIKSPTHLFSDQGDKFQINTGRELTILTNPADFSLLPHLEELQASGCSRFHIDLSHCGPFSVKGRAVLKALAAKTELPETTAFNFERGLE